MRGTTAIPAAATLLGLALLAAPPPGQAQTESPQELIPHAQDRPPNPPRSPEEAVAAMTVPDGFAVEVVAAEPDLVNPVAMAFDERGRIWVTESLEYPRREPGPGRDRVKVLEDTDADGRADRFTVFADGLNIPSGVAVGHGGVWVANSPDILFYPDSDRDAKPDGPPEVVVTGFGRADTHELPNSLTWGPDGWLYGWNGVFNPSRVTSSNGRTYAFTCAIFRIHPRTREFQVWCEGTSNPWGLAFNEEGDAFASACVIDHLWHLTETGYYIRQGGPYPPFTWPARSIVDHAHQKAAYCGIHYYDSSAYPPEYRGRLYMGNIHGNAINVDRLERDGATYRAESCPDFLAANDAWFMPVSQTTGPDGCLYLLDWYDRYHCYQDANRDPAGIDRLKGRLYRVRYRATPRRAAFDLATQDDSALIEALGSENGFDRETSRRLLCERLMAGQAGPEARPELEAFAFDPSRDRRGRLGALWTLQAGAAINPAARQRLLTSPDPIVRAWAIRDAGDRGGADPAVLEAIRRAALDPAPQVRVQAAIAASKLDALAGERVSLLLKTLDGRGDDPLIPHIAWQNLYPALGSRGADLARELARVELDERPDLAPILPRAVDCLLRSEGSREYAEVIVDVVARLFTVREPSLVRARRETIEALAELGRERRLDSRTRHALFARLAPALADSLDPDRPAGERLEAGNLLAALGDGEGRRRLVPLIADADLPAPVRLSAFATLVAAREPEALTLARRILEAPGDHPVEFRSALVEALGPLEDPQVAALLLELYPRLEPRIRDRTVVLLTGRAAWARLLLEALRRGDIPRTAVNVNQVRKLQLMGEPDIATSVRDIWGTVRADRDPRRELVVGQMGNFLRRTPGRPIEGREVFRRLCAQCHRLYGEGQEVGPDITRNGRNDFDQLLSNVLDPNLVIGPGYQATTIATTDGRIVTGLLAEDSPQRIVLKLQGGETEAIPRADIEEQATGSVSLMPEGIETQLAPQELADLFSFLSLDGPPEDAASRRLPGAPAAAAPRERPR